MKSTFLEGRLTCPPISPKSLVKEVSDDFCPVRIRSILKCVDQPGTFTCARGQCKIWLSFTKVDKATGPKRPVKIPERWHLHKCYLPHKVYVLAKKGADQASTHCKNLEQNLFFKSALLIPTGSTNAFRSIIFPYFQVSHRSRVRILCRPSFRSL